MAITSTFYTGAVDNVAWAKGSGRLGFSYVAHGASDCKVTAVSTGTRTVRVAPGAISGAGVTDVNDSSVDIALPNVTSGSQWFLIVADRVWQTTNATSFTYVEGTATRQLPPRIADPGVQDQQPLALVRIQEGQTLPQEIIDLRVIGANNGVMVGFDELCLGYLADIGTVVRIGDVEWVRGISAAGSAVWLSNKKGEEPPFVQIGRSIPFSSAISSTSLPLYAAIPAGSGGSAETKSGDWGAHFTFANGASSNNSAEANPSRITTKTAGVYRVKLVTNVQLATGGIYDVILETPAPGVNPRDRGYAMAGQDRVVTLTEEGFLPAGAVIRAKWGATQPFLPKSWYMSATRIGD